MRLVETTFHIQTEFHISLIFRQTKVHLNKMTYAKPYPIMDRFVPLRRIPYPLTYDEAPHQASLGWLHFPISNIHATISLLVNIQRLVYCVLRIIQTHYNQYLVLLQRFSRIQTDQITSHLYRDKPGYRVSMDN